MSLTEQSAAESSASVQPESSDETQQSAESQQTSPPIQEGAEEEESSAEGGSGSGSDSGSTSESCDGDEPASEPGAVPDVPLEGSSKLPSRGDLSAAQGPQENQEQDSQKQRTASPLREKQDTDTEFQVVKPKKKPLKSLKDFPYEVIFPSWYDREKEGNGNIFKKTR